MANYQARNWYLIFKDLPEDDFVREFRISKQTFHFISGLVGPYWTRNDVKGFDYHVDERVAMSLWRLASGASCEEVSEKFAIPRATVAKNSYDVYVAIDSELKGYLRWPNIETQARIKSDFEKASGIPNIVGTLYTTHLEIKNHGRELIFVNPRKKGHFLPVQGVVSSIGQFIDVFCDAGVGGRSTDEEVLEVSKLREKIGPSEFIVGGNTYPLEDWLMVPYVYSLEQTNKQWLFDSRLFEVQETARNAFGQLLGRWSYLQKRIDVDRSCIPTIVRACCILHNICQERNDELDLQIPTNVSNDPTPCSGREASQGSMELRDRIADTLFSYHGGHLGYT